MPTLEDCEKLDIRVGIVTEITPFEKFYVAEDYHKNYYDRALVDILVKSKGHIKSFIW